MDLILDASSSTVATALARDGHLVWTGQWVSQNDHTKRLMAEVLRGLEHTSLNPKDITSIIVALGPGPFNGLRVAIAAAKGFAVGTGAHIYGISTLEAEAARCPSDIGVVRPVLRAGKSGYTTAAYARTDGKWHAQEEMRIVDIATLIELSRGVPLCGETGASELEQIRQTRDGGIRVIEPVMGRPEALALLGAERIAAGDFTPLASVQPVYARPPHITQPRERRA